MAVCREYKISYSHFKGGPQTWTNEDQAKAIAHEVYLKSSCPRCGTHPEDHQDEDGKPLEEPMWYAVIRDCKGCGDFHAVDKEIPQDLRARGLFTTWIPSDEWSPEDDDVIDDIDRHRRQSASVMKAPGLEG